VGKTLEQTLAGITLGELCAKQEKLRASVR